MPPKIIAIIPARGGSKGIPRKNLKLIRGKPLIAYSIEQSLKTDLIIETYVSTEDEEIKNISHSYGAKIIDRPPELAKDTTSTEKVLLHAVECLKNDFDYIILLQPTSPLRYSEQIDEAINLILKKNGDSLLSVYINDSFFWNKQGNSINYNYQNRPRRQEKEWEYVENGSIYITKKEILIDKKNRLGGKILMYLMPKWMSFEIDEPFDMELIEFLVKTKFVRNSPVLSDLVRDLKLIIFDVDGVFTDGSVYLNEDGKESLKFSRIDGKGIELLIERDFKTAVITSEKSEIVKKRMSKLNINDTFINIKDKMKIYNDLKEKYSLIDKNICYLGDDIQDLKIIKKVGLSCCPINAQQPIKKHSIYISPYKGGNGFVRDVCNLILNNFK